MRSDIGKVITERGRSMSSLPSAKFGKTIPWGGWDEDYAEPKWQSGSQGRVYGYKKKEFTDVLGPIYRYLDKQVGRPWNKVYSELCEVLDKRKLTHAHVFTHVSSRVEKDVYLGKDGQFYPTTGFFTFQHSPVNGLYVHPRSGLVLRQKPREEKKKPEEITEIKLSETEFYEKLSGVWYRTSYRKAFDHELLSKAFNHQSATKLERGLILERKRQLGKKDLKVLRTQRKIS